MFKKSIVFIMAVLLLANTNVALATFSTGVAQSLKIEGEAYSATNGFSALTLNGTVVKMVAKVNTATEPATGGYYVSYNVATHKAGMYEMTFVANLEGKKPTDPAANTVTNRSPYKISVNGNVIDISTAAYYSPIVDNVGGVEFYTYKINVPLEEGSNDIQFIVNEKRLSNNTYFLYLDYFTLKYINDFTKVRIEGEMVSERGSVAYVGYNLLTDPQMSGGCAFYHKLTTQPEWTYDIQVGEAGNYYLTIVSYPLDDATASDYTININNGTDIQMSTTNAELLDLGRVSLNTGGFSMKKYKLTQPVVLQSGLNKVKVKVTEVNSTFYKAAIDYIEFKKERANLSADVVISQPAIVRGETTSSTVTVYDTFGETVASSGYAVAYSSENSDIATVDASTGVVTGVAAGETNIIATITFGETTWNKSSRIKVLANSGIDMMEASIDGSIVNINATSWVSNSPATFLVATYGNNGSVQFFQNIGMSAKQSSWTPGLLKHFAITVDGIDSATNAKLFIWDDINTLYPQWVPVTLK